MIGLLVYNSKKELKGNVTARYISETNDQEVLLIDDDWEVAINSVEWVLWTLISICTLYAFSVENPRGFNLLFAY